MYGSKTKRVVSKKKRAPKVKPSRYTQPATINRVRGTGFPDRITTKLKYCDTISLAAGTGPAQYVIRGNSCFDPNSTGGGHQPLFFDQWIAVYEKYRVIGSSIVVHAMNRAAETALLIVLPTSSVPVFSTYTAMLEQKKASVLKLLPPQQYIPSSTKRYSSTIAATGATRTELYDDTYAAVFSANPVNLWYWILYGQALDLVSALDIVFAIEVTYYVEFFDRQNVAQS